MCVNLVWIRRSMMTTDSNIRKTSSLILELIFHLNNIYIMKKIKDLIPAKMLLMGLLFAGTFVACESNFLDRNPTDILLEDQMWSNEQNVLSLLADLYDRLPEYQQIQGWWEFTNFDDAFASNAGDYWRHQEQSRSEERRVEK